MTARPILPDSRSRPVRVAIALCIMMVAVLLTAGCTITQTKDNLTGALPRNPISQPTEESVLFYHVTIPQAEGIHPDYIKMDSDVYNQGEVIKFHVVNEGSESLACWRTIPSLHYHLYRQIGTWESQPEPTETHIDYGYYLKPGESTPVQQINTTELLPGHYKIVTDCGVSREFEIHAAPGMIR